MKDTRKDAPKAGITIIIIIGIFAYVVAMVIAGVNLLMQLINKL
jgi:hypothetical protein